MRLCTRRIATASVAAACVFWAAAGSLAQQNSTANPFVWSATVTTAPAQVIGLNNSRKRIKFYNPNASVTVAVCPLYSRNAGSTFTCAVNGAGSITILPYSSAQLDGMPPTMLVPTGWNAVGSGSGNLTIFEWE